METLSSHESTARVRQPGEPRHPRLWGLGLAVLSGVFLALLVVHVSNMAPPGRYGQLELSGESPTGWIWASALLLLGTFVVSIFLAFVGRPARVVAVVVLGLGLVTGLTLALGTPVTSVFSGGEGCIGGAYSTEELRVMWADRPTVGELMTGGLVQGNVADDAALQSSFALSPDSAGCRNS